MKAVRLLKSDRLDEVSRFEAFSREPAVGTHLMPDELESWADQVSAGDRRAVARAISAVENQTAEGIGLVKLLFPRTGRAETVGVTGSPGTGKSTLVEKLAGSYRQLGKKVGIIAVDPTSPFSGGAILGDRIRMQSLSTDDGVYIRSMATRGHLGGLAAATLDVAMVLEAAGCETVLVETVGVGQDEVEVATLADSTVLLLAPGMGDDVQAFKAGVMEIADVFVINKADRPDVERLEHELAGMLSLAPRANGWRPPVVKTIATTGEGVAQLGNVLSRFRDLSEREGLARASREAKWRLRLLRMVRDRLLEGVMALSPGVLDRHIAEVIARRRDPHSVVDEIVGQVQFKPQR